MATDAAFLDEVQTFLNTSSILLPQTADGRASSTCWEAPLSPLLVGKQPGPRSTDEALTLKRNTRREKESLRKQRYQRRLKNERETLRRMESQLSAELGRLQQNREKKRCRVITALAQVVSASRESAKRQRGRRAQAEAEQARLVAGIEVQTAYLASLRHLLPSALEDFIKMEAGAAFGSTLASSKLVTYARYRAHLQEVHACYEQVDGVFRSYGLTNLTDGIVASVHRRGKGNDVEYFQHVHNWTQPFKFEQTHETMWKLSSLAHRQQDREDVDSLGDPNDTVVISFRLVHALATGSTVSVAQRYVFRRFLEENHTVFVWKTHSEGEGDFRGVHSDETGWICLQPSTEEDTTMISVCVRQTPVRFTSSLSAAVVADFQQVMQRSVAENAREVTTGLTRLLVQETLAVVGL
jgi:hypothetical protein